VPNVQADSRATLPAKWWRVGQQEVARSTRGVIGIGNGRRGRTVGRTGIGSHVGLRPAVVTAVKPRQDSYLTTPRTISVVLELFRRRAVVEASWSAGSWSATQSATSLVAAARGATTCYPASATTAFGAVTQMAASRTCQSHGEGERRDSKHCQLPQKSNDVGLPRGFPPAFREYSSSR
jgi:hypothetical protein